MATRIVYGIGGAIDGTPNAEGVPANIPAQNIVEYVQTSDTRPAEVCTDSQGRPLTPQKLWESQRGWTTSRCVGDSTLELRITCPKADSWNHRCAASPITPMADGMTAEQVVVQTAAAADTLVKSLEGHTNSDGNEVAGLGCPEHDAPDAEPTAEDMLLAQITPEQLAAFVAAAQGS